MSLLNYTKHVAPTSHKDILSKIRTFAVAQGWASDDYQTSVQWGWDGAKYDWITGTEDFLQLSSNGYGSQDMIVRFRWLATGVDPQAEVCYLGGIDPGAGTPDDTESQHPVDQDKWNSNRFYDMSLSPGAITALWLFGNDKFIIAIMQMTETLVMMLYFGTVELFDSSEDEAYMVAMSHFSNPTFYDWHEAEDYDVYFQPPWWQQRHSTYYIWYYDGGGSGDFRYSAHFHSQSGEEKTGRFNRLDYAVAANNFTGKRTLIKPTVFLKRDSDGLWFPVGTFPFYAIEYAGLTIGQQLDYGSEEYLCFPNIFHSRKYGTAFRII